MNRWATLRDQLDRIPFRAWLAIAVAAFACLLAFATSAPAAVLIVLALAACAWAYSEARRFVIAPSREARAARSRPADLAPLLEALPDPAMLVDAERRIAGSNAAARQELDFEARGQFLTSVIRHPDVLEAVNAAIVSGARRAVEYETKVGVERHTRCAVAPVGWGEKPAVLMVFHDQTARVSTERMRADFLANASHELRTPLASLTLLIETISGPARDNAQERGRFLDLMKMQAERMRRLIDDLLSLSRIELDEHIPPSDRADLGAVARESVDLLEGVARERGVRLALRLGASPISVVGERFQLAQVIQNLVDNAVKYTPSGAEVVVEADIGGDRDQTFAKAGRRWEGAERVAILSPAPAANRAYAYVRVEDSGPGIERRFLPRLAERFFRVERELGDEKGGTGLGLAIVKHIVNRHRGGLVVESLPGKGSAFAAYVELAEEA